MPLMARIGLDGLRRRFGELAPREQRALRMLGAFTILFAVAVTAFLAESAVGEREERNGRYADTLRLVREKGPSYRDRLTRQAQLNEQLRRELPPLPSIIGEVLGELGQQRQDFQELAPEQVGLPGQRRKPWTRLAIKFPMRKVPITTVYQFLAAIRDKYGDLPLAVTSLDLRLDRSEAGLFNVEMVVSAYRLTEPAAGEGGESATREGGESEGAE